MDSTRVNPSSPRTRPLAPTPKTYGQSTQREQLLQMIRTGQTKKAAEILARLPDQEMDKILATLYQLIGDVDCVNRLKIAVSKAVLDFRSRQIAPARPTAAQAAPEPCPPAEPNDKELTLNEELMVKLKLSGEIKDALRNACLHFSNEEADENITTINSYLSSLLSLEKNSPEKCEEMIRRYLFTALRIEEPRGRLAFFAPRSVQADFKVEIVAVPNNRVPRATTLATILAEGAPLFRLPRKWHSTRREEPVAVPVPVPAPEPPVTAPVAEAPAPKAAEPASLEEQMVKHLEDMGIPVKNISVMREKLVALTEAHDGQERIVEILGVAVKDLEAIRVFQNDGGGGIFYKAEEEKELDPAATKKAKQEHVQGLLGLLLTAQRANSQSDILQHIKFIGLARVMKWPIAEIKKVIVDAGKNGNSLTILDSVPITIEGKEKVFRVVRLQGEKRTHVLLDRHDPQASKAIIQAYEVQLAAAEQEA